MSDEHKTKRELIQELCELRRRNEELEILKAEITRANLLLRSNEKRYKYFTSLTSDYVYSCIRAKDTSYRIDWMTGAFEKVTSYTTEELIRTGCWVNFVHPEDRVRVQKYLLDLKPQQTGSCEFRIIRKDSGISWLRDCSLCISDEERPGYYRLFGASEDITEQKWTQMQLEFKNTILSTQQEASLDGILVVNRYGRILSCNKRFIEMWGIPPDVLESKADGHALDHVLHKLADPAGFLERVTYLYRQTSETSREEIELADGRIFDRYSAPIIDEDKKYHGRVWYFRDISDRKQMEEEHLRVRKLESITTLSKGIAHDFNNFLTSILGYISLSKASLPPEDTLCSYLTIAENSCIKAKELVQQLGMLAKSGDSAKRVIPTARLLKASVAHLFLEPKWKLTLSAPDDLWSVEADENELHRVVGELVKNACEAMPEGGAIDLRAENIIVGPQHMLPLKEGPFIRMSVTDHGEGIEKKNLAKIFEPYFTTKRMDSKSGVGLGLSVCYSAVKEHKGIILAESEPGKGAAIHIYLPAVKSKS